MAKFCTNCGAPLEDGKECTSCGNGGSKKATEVKTEEKNESNYSNTTSTNTGAKNKVVTIVLACLFLIGFPLGLHNFYLGYTKKGITQLLLTVIGWLACGIGPIISWIWSLIDLIQILSGSISTDANGVPLE